MATSSGPQIKHECGHCLKPGTDFKRCGRCKVVYYCNRDCQKAHWFMHKPYCWPEAKDFPREKSMRVYYGPKRTSDEHRAKHEKMIHEKVVKKHGNVAHCAICGDTQSQCELRRCGTGKILCVDCIKIQLNM